MNVTIEQVPAEVDLQTYSEAADRQLGSLGAEIVGRDSATMGGQEAGVVTSKTTRQGQTVYLAQIFTIHEGNAYVLTLGASQTSYDASYPKALAVAESFTFGG